MKRILHFGPGNFFRAHLAEYTADAKGWAISTVSLRSPDFADNLDVSKGYTLAVQGSEARRIRVIDEALVAGRDTRAILERIADPEVHVISATVTEKGYGVDPTDVAGEGPSSFVGFLVHGLAKRTAPVTVLSCDNGSGNGDRLARAVDEFCQAAQIDLPCEVTFPNAMVDRITPASTDALRAQFDDPLVVACEPFKEWVIEDRFCAPRPDWPGVQWVDDVTPHEARKLRMLNGAHSALAYAGSLAGHTFVHEAIADPNLRAMVRALMAEAAETLPRTARDMAPTYSEALLARFENPHLRHSLRQIAMDGSQKLPYRIIETLRARDGMPSPALAQGLRAWIAFCHAETQAGRQLQDPRANDLALAQTDADFMAILGAQDLASRLSE